MYTRTYGDRFRFRTEYVYENGSSVISNSFADLNGSRSGEKGTDWKMKIRNGTQAGTPFTSDRAKVLESTPATSELRFRSRYDPTAKILSQRMSGFARAPTAVQHLSISSTSAENTALAKIHKRIREQTTSFNGQSFIGELGDTIRMLKHPAEAIRDKITDHLGLLEKRRKGIRGPNRKAKKRAWADVLSSTWLETQFGIIPLQSDVRGIIDALLDFEGNAPKRAVLTSRSTQSIASSSNSVSQVTSGFYSIVRNNESYRTDVSCQYRVGMNCKSTADFSSATRLRNTLGFNLESFVPALWEVLPWSWLADYFTNTGSILEAMTTDQTNVAWVLKTVRRETILKFTPQVDPTLTEQYLNAFGYRTVSLSQTDLGTQSLVRRTVTRTLLSQLGVPSLEFSAPGIDSKRWLNILAVWAQRRKTVESIRF